VQNSCDGLNLTCLDAVQGDLPIAKAFPLKQAFVHISVCSWLRKQQARFAEGQPKGHFQMKELDKYIELLPG